MNWPNGLSVARLIMGPIVLVCLVTGYVRLAFYIFVVAMFTDLCDGYLARRSNRVTEFGKLMDPPADKVLVSLVLVGLLFMGLSFVSLSSHTMRCTRGTRVIPSGMRHWWVRGHCRLGTSR